MFVLVLVFLALFGGLGLNLGVLFLGCCVCCVGGLLSVVFMFICVGWCFIVNFCKRL